EHLKCQPPRPYAVPGWNSHCRHAVRAPHVNSISALWWASVQQVSVTSVRNSSRGTGSANPRASKITRHPGGVARYGVTIYSDPFESPLTRRQGPDPRPGPDPEAKASERSAGGQSFLDFLPFFGSSAAAAGSSAAGVSSSAASAAAAAAVKFSRARSGRTSMVSSVLRSRSS
ncbi:MAG: hypothetical protein RIR77_1741, partial [Planctomycetota bacterium]